MIYIKILIILLTLHSVNYAGTIDPSISDTKYTEYAKDFHYVISICGTDDKDVMFCGSAVAIDDHHIITAAHVVNDCKSCYVTINDKKFMLSKVIIHKDFDSTFGIADIAIGYSENSFDLDFYPELYNDDKEVGKICSISGFGLTGNFNTGAIKHDGKRRAGSNTISGIEKDMLMCNPSYKNNKDYTALEFFIASGDSGGGLFIDGKLAGVNSCVMVAGSKTPKSKYGEESGHTRISKFIEWIQINKTKY